MAKFTKSNRTIIPDGTSLWDRNITQPMSDGVPINRITNAADAVGANDYVTKVQMDTADAIPSIVRIKPVQAFQAPLPSSISYQEFDNLSLEFGDLNSVYIPWDANDLAGVSIPSWATGLLFRIYLQVDGAYPAVEVNNDPTNNDSASANNDQQHLHFYLNDGAADWEEIGYANQGVSVKNVESLVWNDVIAIPHPNGPSYYQIKLVYTDIAPLPTRNQVNIEFWLTGYYK